MRSAAVIVAAAVLSSSTRAEELWVCSGTTEDLGARRDPYHFDVPAGKRADRIVDIGIDGGNNSCYAWFRGSPREVSGGSTEHLGCYRNPYTSTFPNGYDSGDVAGIAITASRNTAFAQESESTFVFFKDGKFCAGTTGNPRGHDRLYQYVPAGGKGYANIVAMAMDGSFKERGENGEQVYRLVVFAWYDDGSVSAGYLPRLEDRLAGTVTDLDSCRKAYSYKLPKNWKPGMEILGIGIDDGNNHVYTWYRTTD